MKRILTLSLIVLAIASCNQAHEVQKTELTKVDSLWFYNGVPYTGEAYDAPEGVKQKITYNEGRAYKVEFDQDGAHAIMTYDGRGNLVSGEGRWTNGAQAFKVHVVDGKIEYLDGYNKTGRLSDRTTFKDGKPDKTYQYDPFGKLILPLEEKIKFKNVKTKIYYFGYGEWPGVEYDLINDSDQDITEKIYVKTVFYDLTTKTDLGGDDKSANGYKETWRAGFTKNMTTRSDTAMKNYEAYQHKIECVFYINNVEVYRYQLKIR